MGCLNPLKCCVVHLDNGCVLTNQDIHPCWGRAGAVLVPSDYESIWCFTISENLSRHFSQLQGAQNKENVAKLGFCICVVCLIAMTRCPHKGDLKCLSFQFRPSWRESHGGSSWWHYIYGQEVQGDESWHSAFSPCLLQSRPPAHGMVFQLSGPHLNGLSQAQPEGCFHGHPQSCQMDLRQ